MSKSNTIPIVITIIVILALAGLILAGVVVGEYNSLVEHQQKAKQAEGNYGAALDLGSEKIEAVWKIYKAYLGHEETVLVNATRARGEFYAAAKQNDPEATVESALAFQADVLSVAEAYPELYSQPLAEGSLRSMEESINEMKTALDDWNYYNRQYNTKRNMFFGRIIGGAFGFPQEYEYYQGQKTNLDVSEIMT